MALFPWKKSGEGKDGNTPPPNNNGKSNEGAFEHSPEKATIFFERARTQHDIGSYDYAMNLWLSGLRFDPGNLDGIRGFTSSASAHTNSTGSKSPSKDLEGVVSGRTPVHKYLGLLLAWGFSPLEAERAIRTTQAASELGLREAALYMGGPALKLAMNAQRLRKDQFVRLMEIFTKNEAFDLAVVAGDHAVKADPSDAKLSADLRNLAARSTMSKGGFSQSGEAGGFRGNIKDLEKQRQLEEAERIVKTGDVLDRVVAQTKSEYEGASQDRPTIVRYVKALTDRGTPADEETAIGVLTRAFEQTQEFRFRQAAGELKMKQGRRVLRELEAAHKSNPGDAGTKAAWLEADAKQVALETSEYEALVAAYPTDLKHKFELGRRYFAGRKYTEAIGQFQQSKNDGKNRVSALNMLGLSFEQIDWMDEAIDTFRAALDGYADPNDEQGMELRYHLMLCLSKRGAANKDLASAEEADKLASAIAMHNITYKDVRDRRTSIKALITQLKTS